MIQHRSAGWCSLQAALLSFQVKANQLALEQADAAARPTGRTLREFLNLPQFAGGRIT
jgi:hypothetical protein